MGTQGSTPWFNCTEAQGQIQLLKLQTQGQFLLVVTLSLEWPLEMWVQWHLYEPEAEDNAFFFLSEFYFIYLFIFTLQYCFGFAFLSKGPPRILVQVS